MIEQSENPPDPEDVILWPDYTWCWRHELSEMNHKSDDFQIVYAGTKEWEDFFYD